VVDLTPLLGLIPELDETNNQMALLFAAGLPFFPQLGADFFLAALDILSVLNNENMLMWIEAILTGDTDNPALMVASVLFSLLPVIGAIPTFTHWRSMQHLRQGAVLLDYRGLGI
jgi:hypothetical protein